MPISGSFHPSFQFHRKPKNPKNPLTKIDIRSDHHPQDQNPGFGDIMRTQQSQKVINGDQKGSVKYKECRKNHAASIGGYAVDGCREFMASGEEGTSGALKCAACNCHRNFHKKEVEDEYCLCDCSSTSSRSSSRK